MLGFWNTLQDAYSGGTNVAFGLIELLTDSGGDSSTPLLSAVASNYLLVVSAEDASVLPFGPGGPSLDVKQGFQLFRRTCDADEVNHLELVPLDTVVDLVPLATPRPTTRDILADFTPRSVRPASEDYDDFVATCGITLATAQLGQPAQVERDEPVMSFAWPPAGNPVYFISGEPTLGYPQDNRIMSLDSVSFQPTVVSEGLYIGPVQVATGGNSLLVYSYRPDTMKTIFMMTTRISLASSQLPVIATWGETALAYAGPVFTQWPDRILSPDGSTVATTVFSVDDNPSPNATEAAADTIDLLDVATATPRPLSNPTDCPSLTPLAWAPTGDKLLVGCEGQSNFWAAMGLDGVVSPFPDIPADLSQSVSLGQDCYAPAAVTNFWSASGPHELMQNDGGVRVYNIATQQLTVLVEANRVAPQTAPTQAVVGTEQVFAWAEQCFGLGETMCNAELRRLSIKSGVVDVVATAPRPLVFAVSPTGPSSRLPMTTTSTSRHSHPEPVARTASCHGKAFAAGLFLPTAGRTGR